MATVFAVVNRLLPFATPGTPLIQDLLHLAAICVVLYFAPQVQDWYHRRAASPKDPATAAPIADNAVNEGAEAVAEGPAEVAPPVENVGDAAQPADLPQEQQVNGHAVQVEDHDETDYDDDAVAGEGPSSSANRDVGAKKLKSLQRKDQKRAYHEFMRSQGEAQRARDAEGAAEREAALEVERKRRAAAEADLAAKKAKEREQKREAEQAEREAEIRRRESAVAIVKADLQARNLSDLHRVSNQVGGDVDGEWVEKVIRASGLIGRKDGVLTMITTLGWAARVTEQDAHAFYDAAAVAKYADENGYMEETKLSETLVQVLSRPSVAVDA